eukprot:m.74854 g.74854  ORF g.74854 m.74854 type:complete len:155 (+) comp12482_c0_seq7:1328-1792(+)
MAAGYLAVAFFSFSCHVVNTILIDPHYYCIQHWGSHWENNAPVVPPSIAAEILDTVWVGCVHSPAYSIGYSYSFVRHACGEAAYKGRMGGYCVKSPLGNYWWLFCVVGDGNWPKPCGSREQRTWGNDDDIRSARGISVGKFLVTRDYAWCSKMI